MQVRKGTLVLLRPHSPGQNFGVSRYYTPEKIFMWSIQNKTPNDMSSGVSF